MHELMRLVSSLAVLATVMMEGTGTHICFRCGFMILAVAVRLLIVDRC
jgi:hypothetical protein